MTEGLGTELLLETPPPLLLWYGQNARDLPWRRDPAPYRVWLSEIMLQQTRVEAVKPYFARFLEALPDIPALARAPEPVLMKLWEGLGYYNRARNLQKAARIVAEQYGGTLPASNDQLLKLPGFGPYTAGAVASFAFGLPVPAVDGNVLRVVSRLLASRADISRPEVKAAVSEGIRTVLEGIPDQAGSYNQAIMELGATLCGPNTAPDCAACPLSALCLGYRQGIARELPVKAPKRPRRAENRTVFLLVSRGRAAVRRRPEQGLLAGLWELPNAAGALTPAEARAWLREQGLEPVKLRALRPAKHIFTHVEWHMTGYLAETEAAGDGSLLWVSGQELREQYTIPSAFRAYSGILLELLEKG